MTSTLNAVRDPHTVPKSRLKDPEGRFGIGPSVSCGVLLILVLVAILAPVLSPFGPEQEDLALRLSGPSAAHLLGTDVDGRDVLTRLMWGTRSAFIGLGIMAIVSVVIGLVWGLVAGFAGGWVDSILMRLADTWIAFPAVVLAIAIAGVLGPSLVHGMIALGIVFAPVLARLLRTQVLAIRRTEYVLIARSQGQGRIRCAIVHILPNSFGPALVQIFVNLSLGIILEASLSFLGLGVQPPAPSWGESLAQAYQYFAAVPFETVAPGLLVAVAAFSIAQVGDGLRQVLVQE